VTAPDVTAGDALREALAAAVFRKVMDREGKRKLQWDHLEPWTKDGWLGWSTDLLALPELRALIAERDELRGVVGRVREIHADNGYGYCEECSYSSDAGAPGAMTPWPCPTAHALDATNRPRIDAQGVTGVSGSTRDDETVGDE
jgi:hypothetical protein